ncbi:hypothetical protein KAW64_11900, partial [bacterium]|nr:hypothetical protein [bacterium]
MSNKLKGVRFKPWQTDSAGDRARHAPLTRFVAWTRYSHWHVSDGATSLKSGKAASPDEAEQCADGYLLSEGALLDGATTVARKRPVWLLGDEPDWAAVTDCWWGGVDAESYEHAAIEDAISELVAEMGVEHIAGELVVEAHRMAVLADDEPALRPLDIAEAVIETLDEEYGWEDGPEHNGGTTAIQAAARVFCAAVRKHYE